MGSKMGWFGKPPEFWLFDKFFGSGEKSRQQLEYLASMDPEKDSDYDKFWEMGSGLEGARAHFETHWLGNQAVPPKGAKGLREHDFFPENPKDEYLKMLRTSFQKAAQLALDVKPGQPPKALNLVWNLSPSKGFLGVGVANGPFVVAITLTTPPFSLVLDEEQGTHVRDQAWSWMIPPDGDGTMKETTTGVRLRDDLLDETAIRQNYGLQSKADDCD